MSSHYTEQEVDDFLLTKGLRRLEPYKDASTNMKLECISNGRIITNCLKRIRHSKKEDYSIIQKPSRRLLIDEINNRIKENGLLIEYAGNYNKGRCDWHCTNPDCPTHGGKIWNGSVSRVSLCYRGCPSCCLDKNGNKIKNDKYTHEEIVEMVKGRPIELISHYQGMEVRADWRCKALGHVFHTKVRDVIHCDTNCPECGDKVNLLTIEDIQERMKDRTDVFLVGDYKGSDTHTEWECYAKGHVFPATPNSVANKGTGCPCCINKSETSIGELIVKYLPSITDFKPQKYFTDINPITHKSWVDFYFKMVDKEFIIEYQGEGHFMVVDRGQGKERAEAELVYQKERDEYKREYCKSHNIFLLEIPYWFTDKQVIEQLQMLNEGNWDKIPTIIVPDVLPQRVRKFRASRRKKKDAA